MSVHLFEEIFACLFFWGHSTQAAFLSPNIAFIDSNLHDLTTLWEQLQPLARLSQEEKK